MTLSGLGSIPDSGKIKKIKNVIKFVNNCLNWVYSKEGYICLKSGFYLDHYVKKFINKIYKNIVLFTGLIFLDKFLINNFANKIFFNATQLFEKFFSFKLKNNLINIKYFVLIFLITVIFTFLATL